MSSRRAWGMCWLLSWLYFFPNQGALAQAASTVGRSGSEIWMPALAALVGGVVSGIVGPILRDIVLQKWNQSRSEKTLREQIEQNYFAPLSASAEKLIWRMSEILISKRSHFLLLKASPKDFNQYKRLSTLYRIAALLGWIRAINLELSALPRGGFGATSPVFKALAKVQSAMADGHGVEERRIRSFCKACNINISALSKDQLSSLAASFEVAMYTIAGDELRDNHHHMLSSTKLHQEFVCKSLVQFLVDKQLVCSIDGENFSTILEGLVSCLGYREALIYREWQDAIGDAVIVKDEHSMARKYRIIGFEEFGRLLVSGIFNWIKPLREFIEDVDFESLDSMDERPRHLHDLTKGVAEVLVAISENGQSALVNPAALEQARKILTH